MSESVMTFIDNAGIRIALERRGNGRRAILFAHGWISSRRMWYDVLDRLHDFDATLYAFDFRGCGRSDRPAEEQHTLEGYASDLESVVAAIATPCTLVGHSMGGKLAQLVASRSALVERMVLVAPGSARGARPNAAHRAATVAAYGSRERIERFQRGAMVRVPAPEAIQRLVDDALIAQREHWIGWYDRGRLVDISECLMHVHVPTLVVGGADDPLAPIAKVKRDVASAIAGSLFVSLKDAGHNLPVETPDEIAAAIRRFGA